ncbi:MAG: hypothetical protein LBU10_04805 [Endomicrobium sp.]|jgi:hypothetical protein|nr:hypothetical protein [Endomicrobium sp.]
MKKILIATITSLTIFANVFAKDTKPIETLECKNEVYIIIDKVILQNNCHQGRLGELSITYGLGGWITNFKIVADYYRYISENNSVGLGITINPNLHLYDIYGLTKFKVPLTNRWFLGVGIGFGDVDSKSAFKVTRHEFFKLFTCFDFKKNVSVYLSYTQDMLYGVDNRKKNFTERFEALNLGIGIRI